METEKKITPNDIFTQTLALIMQVNQCINDLQAEVDALKAEIAATPVLVAPVAVAPAPVVVEPVVSAVVVAPLFPEITSPKFVQVVLEAVINYRIKATNNPTSYDAIGLPSGVSLNNITGVISGKVAGSGIYSFQVEAINSSGKGAETVTLSVLGQSKGIPIVAPAPTVSNIGQLSNPNKGNTQLLISDGASNVQSGISNFFSGASPHAGQVIWDQTRNYWYQYQIYPHAPNPRWVLIKDPTNNWIIPSSVDHPINGSLRFIDGSVQTYYAGGWQ